MSATRKLDERALLALRKARRKAFTSPGWADHVLNNVRAFTTAKKWVAETGRKVMGTAVNG